MYLLLVLQEKKERHRVGQDKGIQWKTLSLGNYVSMTDPAVSQLTGYCGSFARWMKTRPF
jgi:hypothetical protein